MYALIAIWAVTLIASYLLRPKTETTKHKPGNITAPTAEVGREIPVLFGTRDVKSPNCLWYGDLKTVTMDEHGVDIGIKYKLGIHFGLTHGPVDFLFRIRVDEKKAWVGFSSGGSITIDKEHLFGGKRKEGGIKGTVDFEQGSIDQAQNDYLLSKLGNYVPAYRGIAAAVLRRPYLGTTPYIKPWEFRLQRVHTIQDGEQQWYDAKAPIETAIDSGTDIPSGTYDELSPTSDGWKYMAVPRTDTADYSAEDYDDSAWSTGQMPFASASGQPYAAANGYPEAMNTYWALNTKIWLRKTFNIPAENIALTLGVFVDNSAFVWINGTLVVDAAGTTTTAATIFVPYSLLRVGSNSIVVLGVDDEDTSGSDYSYAATSAAASANNPYQCDINPAHLIRECITNQDWGMGYAQADIDDVAFMAAADTLYSEGFGMSLLWDQQEAIEDFIFDVARTIDATLYVDIATGLWTLKLIRDDYDEGSLPELTTSNVERIEDFTRPAAGDLINQVTVKYWESADSQDQSVTVTDDALVQMQGQIIGRTNNYPGITNQTQATVVARRDLQSLSKPLASCTIYGNRATADLREGDAFRLTWPDYDLDAGVIMRVVEIGYGDAKDGRIQIKATEDVWSTPVYTIGTPVASAWTSPVNDPIGITDRLVQEAPYYWILSDRGAAEADNLLTIDDSAGFAIATGNSPTSDALSITIATDSGAGYTEYESAASFCPTALLAAAIATEQGPTTIAIDSGVDLDEVAVGSLAQIDDELLRVDAISDTSATFGRGVLDTVPDAHADNSVVYFWGVMGSDQVQRTASDSVDVKLLTVTGIGQLAQADAGTDTIVIAGRAARPYPPGDFKIDGSSYPSAFFLDAATEISWKHRDRKTQGAELISAEHTSIGPEAGTTYTAQLVDTSDDSLIAETTGITGESTTFDTTGVTAAVVRFVLFAVRGGLDSFFSNQHEIIIDNTWTPTQISTAIWLDAADSSTITLDSGAVSAWSDKSGNGIDATQTTAGYRPVVNTAALNGLDTLTFDGSDDFLYLDGAKTLTKAATVFTTFLVTSASVNTGATLKRLVNFSLGDTTTGARHLLGLLSSQVRATQRRLDADAGYSKYGTHTAGARMLEITSDWSGATITLGIDGTRSTSATGQGSGGTSNTASTEVAIGGTASVSGQCISGDIAELVCISGTVTTADRQKVEGYLAWKWGTQASLPSGHPYESAAPTL